jgi:outer membrane protein TolC
MLAALLVTGCLGPRDQGRGPLVQGLEPEARAAILADPMVRPAAVERPPSGQDRDLPPVLESKGIAPHRPVEIAIPDLSGAATEGDTNGRPLTLPEAVALAFQRQPRLRAYLEEIQQARGLSDIAFAPFLPMVSAGYSVGAYDLNVGGAPIRAGSKPGFTVLPPGFALPVGLNVQTGYELAEMKLQWLICDFGRRSGRYNASRLAVHIHQLQTDRAFQTVANEVALAYYNVLRDQALRRIAGEAVRRTEDELVVARKLEKGGVIEREKVLRAEVQLAESLRLMDASEEALAVAFASLNLAIGLQCAEPVRVAEPTAIPAFEPTLPDCLRAAVKERREFGVARQSVQIAQEGTRVARADFAPRIVSEGTLIDLQQSSPRGRADIALGFIKLEWTLFEGGKKIAERRVADSKVREAMAQAESIADTIAFQVNEAYRRLSTARLGIERARPAVEQARENYRLVRARAAEGDATPSEITDAETALTRAEQNHLNSTYDYLIAVAKIEYAMGTSATPATASAPLSTP